MTEPRIPPLPPESWGGRVRGLLTADLGEGSMLGARRLADLNLCTTLARHERTFSDVMRLGRALVTGAALPFEDRELVVLRTAWNCRSEYEWGEHVHIATQGGVSRTTVTRIPVGPDDAGWDPRQRLLLRAADELHLSARITDATWADLAELLDEQELIELPLVVGFYHLIAFALGSLMIQPQPGLDRLPSSD